MAATSPPDAALAAIIEDVSRTKASTAQALSTTDAKLAIATVRLDQAQKDIDKLQDLSKTLVSLEKAVARVDERLKHMPTKWEMVGVVSATAAALTVLGKAVKLLFPSLG